MRRNSDTKMSSVKHTKPSGSMTLLTTEWVGEVGLIYSEYVLCYIELTLLPQLGGGRVVRRCCVSYITGTSN